MIYFYVFILCSCVGSFANVLIYRLPRKENFVNGRSYCPNCHHTLRMRDMIPIFSWFLLKGKCRWCHHKISIRYPLVEIVSVGIGFLCFMNVGLSVDFFIIFFICELLFVVSVIDFNTMMIPNGLNVSLAILAFISYWFHPEISLIHRLIGMIVISLPMFVMNLIVSHSFGGGDVKLMIAAGFLLGWTKTLAAGLIGIMSASIYALYLLIKKRASRKSHMPFGPFLSLGITMSLFYGTSMIDIYLQLVNF